MVPKSEKNVFGVRMGSNYDCCRSRKQISEPDGVRAGNNSRKLKSEAIMGGVGVENIFCGVEFGSNTGWN